MIVKFQLIVVLLLCIICRTFSQDTFIGKVIDDENRPIGFAHVFFKNDQGRGAITNDVGAFNISVFESNKQDSLVISVLGYHTLFVSYPDILKYKSTFQLESSSLLLNEVTILSDTYLRYLLKEAVANIPNNYSTEKHLQKAYYQNYTISDTSYAEMIEADIALEYNGYDGKKIKQSLYLNQLRRSEDNRNLPDRLRSNNNVIFPILNNNCIAKRSFSKFSGIHENISLNEFATSVDGIKELQVYNQYVDKGDTILTIKISDPTFKILSSKIFSLISINMSDLAIVKVIYGNIWADKDDFSEVVYRKINSKYYPSYIRSVLEFEFDQKTKSHYTSRVILFYDLIVGKKNVNKVDKGKKMKSDTGLREIKMDEDKVFWDGYIVPDKISATEILRSKTK